MLSSGMTPSQSEQAPCPPEEWLGVALFRFDLALRQDVSLPQWAFLRLWLPPSASGLGCDALPVWDSRGMLVRLSGSRGTAFVFGIPTPDGDSQTSPTHLQYTRLGPEPRREPSPAPGKSRCKSPKAPRRFLAATQATPFSYYVTPRRIALFFQD